MNNSQWLYDQIPGPDDEDEGVHLTSAHALQIAGELKELSSKLERAHQELHDALHDQKLLNRALAAESRLENAVIDAVKATVQLGYDHWLTHGTPIRKEDAALVVFDVQRVIGNGKCIHGNGPTCPECRVVETHRHLFDDDGLCACGMHALAD